MLELIINLKETKIGEAVVDKLFQMSGIDTTIGYVKGVEKVGCELKNVFNGIALSNDINENVKKIVNFLKESDYYIKTKMDDRQENDFIQKIESLGEKIAAYAIESFQNKRNQEIEDKFFNELKNL